MRLRLDRGFWIRGKSKKRLRNVQDRNFFLAANRILKFLTKYFKRVLAMRTQVRYGNGM
jgi:hypothetical protein